VIFIVRNLQNAPIAITIDADLTGLQTDVTLPHQNVYAPGTHVAFKAVRRASARRWSYRYQFTYLPAYETKRNCHASYYCVVQEQRLDTLRVYVENRSPGTMSARIEMQPKNIRMSTRFPHMAAYPPQTRTLAFEGRIQHLQGGWDTSYRTQWAFGDATAEPAADAIYHLPYRTGASYRLVQGYNGSFSHRGSYALDFALPRGSEVVAARGGVVVAVEERYGDGKAEERYRNRANYVHVLHDDGTLAFYVHLERNRAAVQVGEHVRRGELIGYSGTSGYSAGPHLHFEVVRLNRQMKHVSLPVRFRVGDVIAELHEGEAYTAH
jgi:murein DD-endopeptidase MepM/ murein hydrolase activator NlpD